MSKVTDLFVEAGRLAHEAGELPDALAELAIRLDLAGAGDLLDRLTRTCWEAHDDVCPRCGHAKRDPQPHAPPPPPPPPARPPTPPARPTPPPPPPPPPPQQ